MIPPVILTSGIIPPISSFFGLIIEKSFKSLASFLKCNYGKKTLIGRFSWIFSGLLPYILMGLAIYIIITFPLMILCTTVKGQKIFNSPKSICSPINAASITGLVLICIYYCIYFLLRFFDWFLDGIISLLKLNYSVFTTIGPWIQSTKDGWDSFKYIPVYMIPFVGQGLAGYHELLNSALVAISVSVNQIKELGCSKIINKNFFIKQIKDKVNNKVSNKNDLSDGLKEITGGSKKKETSFDNRNIGVNKYRNYIEEKSKINSNDECSTYDNPCCNKKNILKLAKEINTLFHLPEVQILTKEYKVYNGFILTVQAFFEEAIRQNKFNNNLKKGAIPYKKIYFKQVLKTQNDLISDSTKKLLSKYLYHTDKFDEKVDDKKLMEMITEDISKHDFNNKSKIDEIKFEIEKLDKEGEDYAKSIKSSYQSGANSITKMILKRVCIEIACNIFNTTNSTSDIIESMGLASNIVELFKASSSSGIFIAIFYIICVIVLIVLGIFKVY